MSRIRVPRTATAVLTAVAALAAATVLSGCGAGASARDVVDSAASAAAASGSPTARPTGSASPSPSATGRTPKPGSSTGRATASGGSPTSSLTRRQLDEVLVDEDVFPVGWQARPMSDSVGDGPVEQNLDKPVCERLLDITNTGHASVPATGSSAIVASSREDRAISGVTVAAFAPGDAKRLIDGVRDVVPQCASFTSREEGKTFRMSVKAISVAPMGVDEMYGVQIVTKADSGTSGWAHTAVAARIGDVLVESTYVNLAGPIAEPPDLDLLRKQIDRVRAMLEGRPLPAS